MNKIPYNLYVFMVFISIFPLMDVFNGVFLASGASLPIGITYRFLFFLFLITMIFLSRSPKRNYTFITFIFLVGNALLFFLQSIFLQNPLPWIKEDMGTFVKYSLWVLIPYYLYQRKANFHVASLEKLFVIVNLFFMLGLLVPYFLGIGTQTYATSVAGFKGYFFAQNDLSYAFIMLITFAGYDLVRKVKAKWNLKTLFSLAIYGGDLFCLLLIGTKTGVVYIILVSVVVLSISLFSRQIYSIHQRIWLWLISCFALFWVFLKGISYASQMLASTYERIIYFYYLYDGNLISLLTSTRNIFLETGLHNFLTDQHILFTFFGGQGFFYRTANFGRGLIEMDLFDLFFGFGTVGTIFFLLMMGYFIVLSLQKDKRSIYSIMLIVSLMYSFFAGHVLFSALSTTLLGLICAGIIFSKTK